MFSASDFLPCFTNCQISGRPSLPPECNGPHATMNNHQHHRNGDKVGWLTRLFSYKITSNPSGKWISERYLMQMQIIIIILHWWWWAGHDFMFYVLFLKESSAQSMKGFLNGMKAWTSGWLWRPWEVCSTRFHSNSTVLVPSFFKFVSCHTRPVGIHSQEDLHEFLREAEIMRHFDHENVVRLLGKSYPFTNCTDA